MPTKKKQLTDFYFEDSIKLIIELETTIRDLSKYISSNNIEYQPMINTLYSTEQFYLYHQQHCSSQEVKDLIDNHLKNN